MKTITKLGKAAFLFICLTLSFLMVTSTITALVYQSEFPSLYTNSSNLHIDAVTDKEVYGLGEIVRIYMNLTYFESQVSDGLITVEIDKPTGDPYLFRVAQTEESTIESPKVKIIEVTTTDSQGQYKGSFKRGELAYFKISVKNEDDIERPIFLVMTIYDSYSIPIITTTVYVGSLEPEEGLTIYYSHAIPYTAYAGTAIVYVNVFDKRPRNGGVPYCPEEKVTFAITDGYTPTSGHEMPPNIASTYNISFRLHTNEGKLGNYTVYLNSNYAGEYASNSLIFNVILRGDINEDGKVDIFDAIKLAATFGLTPSDPGWNPKADLNGDGIIDIYDALIFAPNFGRSAG